MTQNTFVSRDKGNIEVSLYSLIDFLKWLHSSFGSTVAEFRLFYNTGELDSSEGVD